MAMGAYPIGLIACLLIGLIASLPIGLIARLPIKSMAIAAYDAAVAPAAAALNLWYAAMIVVCSYHGHEYALMLMPWPYSWLLDAVCCLQFSFPPQSTDDRLQVNCARTASHET